MEVQVIPVWLMPRFVKDSGGARNEYHSMGNTGGINLEEGCTEIPLSFLKIPLEAVGYGGEQQGRT
jgi:hypothetical protein